MTIRNRDEIKGTTNKVIGSAKEKLGHITGNKEMEEQGAADRTAGSFQAGVGKVERKVSNAIHSAKDDLKK